MWRWLVHENLSESNFRKGNHIFTILIVHYWSNMDFLLLASPQIGQNIKIGLFQLFCLVLWALIGCCWQYWWLMLNNVWGWFFGWICFVRLRLTILRCFLICCSLRYALFVHNKCGMLRVYGCNLGCTDLLLNLILILPILRFWGMKNLRDLIWWRYLLILRFVVFDLFLNYGVICDGLSI